MSPFELVRFGLSVFPCRQGTGTDDDKKPIAGFKWEALQGRRPTEQELIDWQRYEPCNWAIVTGEVSGVVVLDIDGAEGEAFVAAQETPETVSVATASGRHLYFRHPGIRLGNRTKGAGHWGRVIPGCDFRGDGGYVMAPGSIHPTGVVYDWLLSIEDTELAPAPEWLVAAVLGEDVAAPAAATAAAPVPAIDSAVGIYCATALESELEVLATATPGKRNHQLNTSAFKLGTLIGAGALEAGSVSSQLFEIAISIGLSERESRATIASGIAAGMKSPRDLSLVARTVPANGNGAPTSRHFAHTDMGNAERLAVQHGNDLRHIAVWGKWFVWDGQRWAEDETNEVARRAKLTARSIYAEALHTEDAEMRKAIAAHARRTEASARLNAMVATASSDAALAIRHTDLDQDGWKLNVLNGTIDLRTGRLLPHDRRDLMSKMAPVLYDATAEAPTWDAFLQQIIGNPAIIGFLQRAVGYALTASVQEQCFFFLHGSGANGKSTFLDVLLEILGDYANQMPPGLLLKRFTDHHPTELSTLFGRRFTVTHEVGQNRALAEEMVKQITGGDMISTRRMKEDFWTFKPTHKIFLAANHKPRIGGTDYAIWRRVRMVPFNVCIPKEQQDQELPVKLLAERSGIFRWAVDGCLEWQHSGLQTPPEVEAATAQYRAEQDELGAWRRERVVLGEGEATAKELYEDYCAFAAEQGDKAISQRAFSSALTEWGCGDRRAKDARYRTGIRLASSLMLDIG